MEWCIELAQEYTNLYRQTFRNGEMKEGREQGIARLTAIARCGAEHYGTIEDHYRAAMWYRRLWLHEHGRHASVYDGADAVRWLEKHSAGWHGPSNRDFNGKFTRSKAIDSPREGLDTTPPHSDAPSASLPPQGNDHG